eukprot:Sspe_Gene.82661::Locus_54181_Transcript_1_1_Confidence_1.000_Length_681::g.82661::m.82661
MMLGYSSRGRPAHASAPFATSATPETVQSSRGQPANPPETPSNHRPGHGQTPDAVNADLVAAKKRAMIENDIRDKEEILASYRAGKVDPQAIKQLEERISFLRHQVHGMSQPPSRPAVQRDTGVTAHQPAAHQGYQPSAPTSYMPATPSTVSTTGAGAGRKTKRDMVWEAKYQAYLRRVAGSAAGIAPAAPPRTHAAPVTDTPPV